MLSLCPVEPAYHVSDIVDKIVSFQKESLELIGFTVSDPASVQHAPQAASGHPDSPRNSILLAATTCSVIAKLSK